MQNLDAKYWENRYQEGYTGWDVGHISGGMQHIIDQLTDKNFNILVPGAGNGYEVTYLWNAGFKNVYLVDWAPSPIAKFQSFNPDFPKSQLINIDFFKLEGQFDLILEQTFFCALPPGKRVAYAEKMNQLLKPGGTLRGLLFKVPMNEDRPPFGGSVAEYEELFSKKFQIDYIRDCLNSEPERLGTEVEFMVTRVH